VRGGGSTIKGFSIVNFDIGVDIRDSGNVWVIGNYIGLRPDGAAAEGNAMGVIFLSGNNHVGGADLAYQNVISGNINGVKAACGSDGNQILNNYIGLTAAGTAAAANSGKGCGCAEATTTSAARARSRAT
jgi:hypothetical protein